MKKRWIIMMALIVIISLIGVFTPETPGIWEPDEKMNIANVAWMITATIFVLMMTPGLSFFYGGGNGREEKYNIHHLAKFHRNGHYQCHLGSVRVQPGIWR